MSEPTGRVSEDLKTMDGSTRKARIAMAQPEDRAAIYEMRHAVYAEELGQHPRNADGTISDGLDTANEYVVALVEGKLAGFISITPPAAGRYSVEKYVSRNQLPVQFDQGLYELRVLTIAPEHRSSRLAAVLMYAAARWVEEQGGRHIIGMGRTEILSIYLKHGLRPLGKQVRCGSVSFELLEVDMASLRTFAESHHSYYTRLLAEITWDAPFPFHKPQSCFHGGAFFAAVGADFKSLERRKTIVSADVLDAWFPPSPRVLATMQEHLPWLLSTSPPTHSEGLHAAIAHNRGVAETSILPGAGSSALIYLAFRMWLTRSSRVLILDPMYGEYVHVLENVIGCEVHRLQQARSKGYALDLEELRLELATGYDMVVLVNPNNPTGRHVPRRQLETVLAQAPKKTKVWVDEAYLEYVGADQSLERFASTSENVIVCKTMSKVYALSGARVGYLCAAPHQLSGLIVHTPPWSVSLIAQVAAVRALEDPDYYAARYEETQLLRSELVTGLRQLGIEEIIAGVANFVLFHLEPEHPTALAVVDHCRKSGVFIRDISPMGTRIGPRALRIAVKDRGTNIKVLEVLEQALPRRKTLPITLGLEFEPRTVETAAV